MLIDRVATGRTGRAPALSILRAATLPALTLAAVLLAGCGGSSTSTQSAGVSSLTTTSSVSASSSTTSASTTATTTTSSFTTSSRSRSAHRTNVKPETAGGTAPSGSSARNSRSGSGAAKAGLGTLAVTSSAFPHGGKIPVRYTCDGGNVSPPLQWGKVPAGTSQMFVMALSLSASARGAVRWAVGGIDPGAHGFAAGQLPAGAVQGRNGEGRASWAGICPAAGKPQAIIVLVYALRHPLQLASGFDPRTVQAELHGNTLATGVVYGAYKRP